MKQNLVWYLVWQTLGRGDGEGEGEEQTHIFKVAADLFRLYRCVHGPRNLLDSQTGGRKLLR